MPAPQVLQASQPPARAEILLNMCSKELSNYLLIQRSYPQPKRLYLTEVSWILMEGYQACWETSPGCPVCSTLIHSAVHLSITWTSLANLPWWTLTWMTKKTVIFKSFVPHFINHLNTHLKLNSRRWCSASGEGKCCVWSHSGKYDLSLGLFSPLSSVSGTHKLTTDYFHLKQKVSCMSCTKNISTDTINITVTTTTSTKKKTFYKNKYNNIKCNTVLSFECKGNHTPI